MVNGSHWKECLTCDICDNQVDTLAMLHHRTMKIDIDTYGIYPGVTHSHRQQPYTGRRNVLQLASSGGVGQKTVMEERGDKHFCA